MNLDTEYLEFIKRVHLGSSDEILRFLNKENEYETITNQKIRQRLTVVLNTLNKLIVDYDLLIYETLIKK
ncbi:MAG: hypothetical protein ACRC0G_04390 [Fusobacteriaceae bacterium]